MLPNIFCKYLIGGSVLPLEGSKEVEEIRIQNGSYECGSGFYVTKGGNSPFEG